MKKKQNIRYIKMSLNPWGLLHLHRRNPWAAAWWSVALPGLGHFYNGSYLKGFILMSWEIVVNMQAHLNLAIYYSLLGQPDLAREVLNLRWALLYPPIYMLAIWDAYRITVEGNKLFELEQLQTKRYFDFHTMIYYGQNMLIRRNPWVAVFWAAMLGGGGHFHNMQMLKGVMLMGWHLAIWLNAGMSRAVHLTLLDRVDLIPQVINYQWLLFWPSIHMFNVWNAYVDCVGQNILMDEANLYWLRKELNKPQQPPQEN